MGPLGHKKQKQIRVMLWNREHRKSADHTKHKTQKAEKVPIRVIQVIKHRWLGQPEQ